MFRLADDTTTRKVIQVANREGTQSFAMLHTMPIYGPTPREPEIRFMETAAGAPIAVRAWWKDGERTGYGFIYSKEELEALTRSASAKAEARIEPGTTGRTLKSRLTEAGEPVSEGPLSGPDVIDGPGFHPRSPSRSAQAQPAPQAPPPPAPEPRQAPAREQLPQTASPLALLLLGGVASMGDWPEITAEVVTEGMARLVMNGAGEDCLPRVVRSEAHHANTYLSSRLPSLGLNDHASAKAFSARSDLVVLNVRSPMTRAVSSAGCRRCVSSRRGGPATEGQFFAEQDAPATIGLLIDASGSMLENRDRVIAGITEFAKASHPDDEFRRSYSTNRLQRSCHAPALHHRPSRVARTLDRVAQLARGERLSRCTRRSHRWSRSRPA